MNSTALRAALVLGLTSFLANAQIVARPPSLEVVSAAGFQPSVAPESLASAFGANLASQLVLGGPDLEGRLPNELDGVSVEVNARRCGLFFVSPAQINFLVPAETELGVAEVIVRRGSTILGRGTVPVLLSAPSLFSLDSSGRGRGAILNAVTNRFGPFEATTPENPAGDQRTRLAVFGTGIRFAGNPERDPALVNAAGFVLATARNADGRPFPLIVEYAGPAPGYAGLDQLNLVLPPELEAAGVMSLTVTADPEVSNAIQFTVREGGGPRITSFAPDRIAPGGEINITGTGFVVENSPGGRNAIILQIGDGPELPAVALRSTATSMTALILPLSAAAPSALYEGPVKLCVDVDRLRNCAAQPLTILPAVRPPDPPGQALTALARQTQTAVADALRALGNAGLVRNLTIIGDRNIQALEQTIADAVAGRPQSIVVDLGAGRLETVALDLALLARVESLVAANRQSRDVTARPIVEKLPERREAAACPIPEEQRRIALKSLYDAFDTAAITTVALHLGAAGGGLGPCLVSGGAGCSPTAAAAIALARFALFAEWPRFATELGVDLGPNRLESLRVEPASLVVPPGQRADLNVIGLFNGVVRTADAPSVRAQAEAQFRQWATRALALVPGTGFLTAAPLAQAFAQQLGATLPAAAAGLALAELVADNLPRVSTSPVAIELGADSLGFSSPSGSAVGVSLACSDESAPQGSVRAFAATSAQKLDVVSLGNLLRVRDDVLPSASFNVASADRAPVLRDIVLESAAAAGGAGTRATVSLVAPAPAEGVVVALASGDPAVVALPASVTIPPGETSFNFPVPAGVVTATRRVTISAILNVITVTATLTVNPPPQAQIDLTVTAASVSPNSRTAGSAVTFNYTVANAGSSPSGGFQARVFLSTDAAITTADTPLAAETVASLGANTSASRSLQATIPANTAPGSYFLGVIVDSGAAIAESDEANNTGSAPFSVVSSLPDLVIDSFTISQSSGDAGARVSSTLVIRNAGGGNVGTLSYSIRLSTDATVTSADTLLAGGASSPGASAGQVLTRSDTIRISAPPGNYFIGAVLDEGGIVSEADETNNRRSIPYTITASCLSAASASQPDLVVRNVSVAPGSGAQGIVARASFEVQNLGSVASSSFGMIARFSTDQNVGNDTFLSSAGFAGLQPCEDLNQIVSTFAFPVPSVAPGPFFVLISVDPGNTVAESNESNNTGAAAFTVTGAAGADLVVDSASVNPVFASPGGQVGVSLQIRNAGDQTSGRFDARVVLSPDAAITTGDTVLLTLPGNLLPAGGLLRQTRTVTVPAGTAPGSYFIGVIADDGGAVAESNESNNTASVSFTVTPPLPDLVVQNVSPNPASASAGGTVAVSVRISNPGGQSAGALAVNLVLSSDANIGQGDTPIGAITVGLGPNATATFGANVTIPVGAAPGAYFIGAIADAGQVVAESNENNNTGSAPFTVTPPQPDLIILNPSAIVSAARPGTSFNVNYQVRNNGAGPSASNFLVRVVLSADAVIDANDTPLNNTTFTPLAAGEVRSGGSPLVTLPNAAPGAYFIGFIADVNGAVAESNENNNTASIPFTVLGPPDLVVQNFQLNLTQVQNGGVVAVTFQVRNQGDTTADVFSYEIRLSNNASVTAADPLIGGPFSSVNPITPGATVTFLRTVTIPVATVPGNYFIGVRVDSAGVVAESSEANNTASAPIKVN